MIKRLLAAFTGVVAVAARAQTTSGASEEALLRQIAERSKTDPLIGVKVGSKEVLQRVLTATKSARGVHVDSLLVALGALSGYACQASLRAQARLKGLPESALLVTVQTKDGKKYFFGDGLNKSLAESQYSVWSLAAGTAQRAGCSTVPDLGEIFKHTSETVGTESFGKPRVAPNHMPQDLPLNYVQSLWPRLLPTVRKFCPNPEHWPILFGLSVQDAIDMSKKAIDPCTALQLVMESAVPMSKIDLAVR